MLAEFQVELSKLVEAYRNRGLPAASIASALEGAANSFRRKADVGHILGAQQGQNSRVGGSTPGGWTPQGEPYSRSVGHGSSAEDGQRCAAPLREPPSPTEAARILQALKPRGPGAGAMRPGAYAARQAVRGESWLLTYQIPNGRDALSMRIGELLPTSQRMLRDGGSQLHAAVVLRRLHDEAQKLGQVSPDQIVGKTLPPAVIDRLSEELTPERVIVEAAKWGRKFVDERAQLAGGA